MRDASAGHPCRTSQFCRFRSLRNTSGPLWNSRPSTSTTTLERGSERVWMPKWFTRGESDPGMTHRGVAPREGKSLWMGQGLWRAVASSPESGARISALEARSGHPG
ncbi:hypothetical protein GS506_10785 [Rhodococcus hoagii]|nr:hypothetical protein [Prescottella equi]